MLKSLAVSRYAVSVLLLGTASGCNKKIEASGIASAVSATDTDHSKRITFILGPIARSITINQVDAFVRNGSANNDIGNILQFGKLDAATVRKQLSTEYTFELIQADKTLNSQLGVAILSKLGEAIHPHLSKRNAVQALRSAVIASLANDDKLSPLEVLANLPVDMDVEIDQVLKIKDELGSVFSQVKR
ncbi:alpha/beta hydrolase [bacterium]|nr:alpha/beta hydrolase [bacterium]